MRARDPAPGGGERGAGGGERGRGRAAVQLLRTVEPRVPRVSAEELVGALAADGDGDAAAGELRHRVGGDQRLVGERLVERPEHAGDAGGHVGGRQHQLVVVGAEDSGGGTGGLQLADRTHVVPDGEGADRGAARAHGERRDQSIESRPAAEEHAERDVGDHPRPRPTAPGGAGSR